MILGTTIISTTALAFSMVVVILYQNQKKIKQLNEKAKNIKFAQKDEIIHDPIITCYPKPELPISVYQEAPKEERPPDCGPHHANISQISQLSNINTQSMPINSSQTGNTLGQNTSFVQLPREINLVQRPQLRELNLMTAPQQPREIYLVSANSINQNSINQVSSNENKPIKKCNQSMSMHAMTNFNRLLALTNFKHNNDQPKQDQNDEAQLFNTKPQFTPPEQKITNNQNYLIIQNAKNITLNLCEEDFHKLTNPQIPLNQQFAFKCGEKIIILTKEKIIQEYFDNCL